MRFRRKGPHARDGHIVHQAPPSEWIIDGAKRPACGVKRGQGIEGQAVPASMDLADPGVPDPNIRMMSPAACDFKRSWRVPAPFDIAQVVTAGPCVSPSPGAGRGRGCPGKSDARPRRGRSRRSPVHCPTQALGAPEAAGQSRLCAVFCSCLGKAGSAPDHRDQAGRPFGVRVCEGCGG